MKIEEVVSKLNEMLWIAEQVEEGAKGLGLNGDMDRIIAILKGRIRLLDPLSVDSIDYFRLKQDGRTTK
jgi:hypothetical protein